MSQIFAASSEHWSTTRIRPSARQIKVTDNFGEKYFFFFFGGWETTIEQELLIFGISFSTSLAEKKKKQIKFFFLLLPLQLRHWNLFRAVTVSTNNRLKTFFFLVLATFSLKRGPSMSASDKRPLFFFSSLPPPVCVFASVGLFNGPSEKLILHQSFRWLFRGKKNKYQNRTRWSGQLIGRVFATSPTGGTCGN